MSCVNPADFGEYYTENMHALGLPTPSGAFVSSKLAVAEATHIVGALSVLGRGATMSELVLATFVGEKLLAVSALGAAGYVGASIGSAAVASGRVLGCGS